MAESNKENKFKHILSSSSFNLNEEEIWANIEHRLPQRKERRPFLWLFSGLFMGILLISVFMWCTKDNGTTTLASQPEPSSMETTMLAGHGVQDLTLNNIKAEVGDNDDNNGDLNSKNVHTSGEHNSGITSNSNSESSVSSKAPALVLENPIAGNEMELTAGHQVVAEGLLPSRQKNINLNQGQDEAENTSIEDLGRYTSQLSSVNHSGSQFLEDQRRASIAELTQLVSLEAVPSLDDERDYSASQILVKRPVRKWHTLLNVRSGLNLAINSYAVNAGEISILDRSISKESARLGTQSDFNILMDHRRGFGLLMGLSYRTDVARYRDQSVVSSTETIIEELPVINDQGFREIEEVGVEQTTINYYDFQEHRIHKSLDVQLGLRKRLLQSGAFLVTINTLLKYNIYTNNKAYHFDDNNGTIIRFAPEEKTPYKTQNGLTYQFALDLEFQLNRYRIGLSPYYTMRPKSILEEAHFYQLRNTNVGLQLSMSFNPFN